MKDLIIKYFDKLFEFDLINNDVDFNNQTEILKNPNLNNEDNFNEEK